MRKNLIAIISISFIIGAALIIWDVTRDLPSITQIATHLTIPSQRITDRNGRLLYDILSGEGIRHSPTDLSAIAVPLQQAVIATEDSNFYTNPGFDPIGIFRAAWINLQSGGTISGGSTITQQLARNLLLSEQERTEITIRRKLREAILAWQISQRLTKDQILALYLNQSYFGDLTYGCEAAAQTYFGKPAAELDLAESALLAGVLQAPAVYNPLIHPDKAQARQKVVLGLMQEAGYIHADQRALAEREPLVFSTTPYPMEAPHFVVMVRNQVDELAQRCAFPTHSSLVIRTTLDLDWQHLAEKAIQKQLENLHRPITGTSAGQGSLDHNVKNAALVAIDPQDGEIQAMVGSADYNNAAISGAINMVTAPRQPGSALKPLIYAAAFDPERLGRKYSPWTPATMIMDVKTTFITHDGNPYTPANYDNQEHGPVLARQALASSLNIPAVKTLQHIGIDTLFDLARGLGITSFGSPEDYDLSLALGGGEVSLLQLSSAYAAFANGGYRIHPTSILEIRAEDNTLLYSTSEPHKSDCAGSESRLRVLDERIAWLISDILSDDNARALGFGRHSTLEIGRPAAVKTGTTSNFHDNWTVGYTPDLVVGVWAGNTGHEPMRDVSGLSGAGPIWHEFMRTALAGRPEIPFSRPPGLVKIDVCALSGLLPTPACPNTRSEWFLEGTQPIRKDNLYQKISLDKTTGALAQMTTPLESREMVTVLDLPPEAASWAHAQGLTLLSDITESIHAEQKDRSQTDAALSILSPRPKAVFRLLPGYAATQRLQIQVSTSNQPIENVTIFVDAIALVSLKNPPYEAWWPLQPGTHTVRAEMNDSSGHRISSETVEFSVLP